MNARAALACTLMGLAVSAAAWGQRCGDGRPRPAWTSQIDSSDQQYYYSAGVSEGGGAQGQRLAAARQQALKGLAEIIQVSVKNSLELTQSRVSGPGQAALSESRMRSVTETSASASLQGAETVETWEDPRSCAMWVRTRVPRALVEQKQKEVVARQQLEVLNERLAAARDAGTPPAEREAALSGGLALLERIDFSVIPEAGSPLYFRQQFAAAKASTEGAAGAVESGRRALAAADQALQQAITAPDTKKEAHFSEAARQLRLLQTRHPNGVPGLIGAQDIQFRLGEVEEMRGNVCGARLAYGKLAGAGPRVDEAKRRVARLACGPAELEREYWRAYIDGRRVQLHCYVIDGAAVKPWPKVCDSVVSHLGGIGAAASASAARPRADELRRLLEEGGRPPRAAEGELPMYFLAQGEFRRRRDAEGGDGFEYQFSGKVGAVVYEGDKPAFSDRFEGVTGWNPISEKMVEDVLGLNVFRRWKDRFGKFVQK